MIGLISKCRNQFLEIENWIKCLNGRYFLSWSEWKCWNLHKWHLEWLWNETCSCSGMKCNKYVNINMFITLQKYSIYFSINRSKWENMRRKVGAQTLTSKCPQKEYWSENTFRITEPKWEWPSGQSMPRANRM